VIENSNMPAVKGNHFTGNVIGSQQSSQPLYTVKGRAATDADRAMADHIAPLIPAGSTCQLGVGGLARSIVERVSIGAVWTEAIGDWVMDLPAWTPITGTIAFGSAELYEWMDNNPAVTMRPARVTNGYAEMRQHRVYSVNQAMMIGLDGGTSLRPGYSGLGGGAETTRNAYRSFVAAPETRKGKCNIGHAGYTLHHPSQRAEYLVTTQGIINTRPHWTAGEFFDGTSASVSELVTHYLAAPEHRAALEAPIRNAGGNLKLAA
jgi:acyl-CoA hydrolase